MHKAKLLWNGVLIRIRLKKVVSKYGNTLDSRMLNRVVHSYLAQYRFIQAAALQRAKQIMYQALYDKAKNNQCFLKINLVVNRII